MKQEIVNYIDNFYNDFISNYNSLKKNTLEIVSNNGFETFHWNRWWPESLLQYPCNRNLSFKVTEKREDDHLGVHLYGKTDSRVIDFFKKTANNPILNSYYFENDYIRPSTLDEAVNRDVTKNFASKYSNLVLMLYGQYVNHKYIFNEYKQILLLVLDNDLDSNSIVVKSGDYTSTLTKKFDKCFLLMDKPFSLDYIRNNAEIENKVYTFCFEFEDYYK